MKYPVALTIAGSDSSGGAGIQADVKTMSALGVYATTAITAVTVQNTVGVNAVQAVTPDIVAGQIDAVFSDLKVDSVKIGMLFSSEIIDAVADRLAYWQPRWVVLDPVMVSTSGSPLISEEAVEALVGKLLPMASVLTPNRAEARKLAGIEIDSSESMTEAAMRIIGKGCRTVLMKGGHFDDDAMTDRLYEADGSFYAFAGRRVESRNTHGTGCTLSSAIASCLALGCTLPDAVAKAKAYLQNALEAGANVEVGKGHGPVNHFFDPQKLNIL